MEARRNGGTLDVEDLTVAAAGSTLLRGVTLRAAAGDRVALVGPSGCGKSTLLRTLAALRGAAAGAVTLDGEGADRLGAPRWRSRVMYVHQTPRLPGDTVRDALAAPFAFAVRSGAAAFREAAAVDALRALGLGADVLDRSPASLSVGERQRVALARGLLLAPDVLLLDEPTAALDEANVASAEAAIRAFPGAVLFVTHDRGQAARLGTRTVDLGGNVP